VCILCAPEWLPGGPPCAIVLNELVASILDAFDVAQCIITHFSSRWFPSLYFTTAFPLAASVPHDLELEARQWEDRKSECRTLIRELYWGNILAPTHYPGGRNDMCRVAEELNSLRGLYAQVLEGDRLFVHGDIALLLSLDLNDVRRTRADCKEVLRRAGVRFMRDEDVTEDAGT
jgi:hypothetical protein